MSSMVKRSQLSGLEGSLLAEGRSGRFAQGAVKLSAVFARCCLVWVGTVGVGGGGMSLAGSA